MYSPNYKDNDEVYLKPNVVIEPLVDNWYAWSHLISPATAALNIVERHVKIMESYIKSPSVHAQATRNPKFLGGPFMDYPEERVEEVKILLEETYFKRKELIHLALAIKDLNTLLLNECNGYSMENLYSEIPEGLKGYVELFYDLNNNPGFRFYEALLYSSKYYDKKAQSVCLWITKNDSRPFCLSTPRVGDSNVEHLQISFDDPRIDLLAKMKYVPGSLKKISEMLEIQSDRISFFKNLFTKVAPPSYTKYDGDKIRMRYFGHACILIETKNKSILIDPLISYYGYDSTVDHFSDLHLPEMIDCVLITHNHQDHILFETLIPLRHRIKKLVVPGSKSGKLEDPDLNLLFKKLGFDMVVSIFEMESILEGDIIVRALPFMGEHSDLNILSKACYLVQISGFKLIFFADSSIIEPKLYQHIAEEIGSVDVIFLGMECDGAPLSWLYGPLMPKKLLKDQDNSRRLAGSDFTKAIPLIDVFEPKEVYVYAMGQEPWVEFISSIRYTNESNPIIQSNKLISYCREKGIVSERLFGEKELLYSRNK